VVAVTMACQSRCTMCDIWRYGRGQEMRPGDYRRLPRSLRQINISGGEPFLRSDLPDVVAVIRDRCRKARILISTNGLSPSRIESMMDRMHGVGVRVSIDGIGAVDDRTRGVPGSYERALETLHRLKAAGHRDLGISATVSRLAAGELLKVKQLADDEGVEFVSGVAHSSEFYFGPHQDALPRDERQTVVRDLIALRDRQLRSRTVKEWFRAYFTDGLIDYIHRRPRRLFCHAGTEMVYLAPEGTIYPCPVLNRPMGSILQDDVRAMQRREAATLEFVQRCPVNCWMNCTVNPAMRKRPWVPAWWVVRARLFGAGKRGEVPAPSPRRIPIPLTDPTVQT
jgi:MoaA/NifB/PqqE/SkfB family radical SAM enzyme